MPFKNGMELKVTGVVSSDPHRFTINVCHTEEDIALHFDMRFNHEGEINTIVFNSKEGASFDLNEEQRVTDFPFKAGQELEVSIVFNFDTFDIYLPNGHMVQFPNRLKHMQYNNMEFVGDATVQGIFVKTSGRPTKR
ncbi:hypothetical protein SKAU_G00120120 [Synaphobranchus kaupii]|uniref:Galectin n=1 Tax=Synaphobranchus kaupii TaxID=118154 RepID=A0A9Q1FNW6_SYNKA|nr:hypothetical protein SKAU_G00120120 [Synaphobranchus kaupii]